VKKKRSNILINIVIIWMHWNQLRFFDRCVVSGLET